MGKLNFGRLAQLIAWASMAFIAYATLTRVGFVYAIYYRLAPFLMHIGIRKYAAIEHFGAFAVFGALFSVAYPKRVVTICCVVFGAAIVLELAQTMTPDRHGTVIDAIQKLAGGTFGILAVKFALSFWHRRHPAQAAAITSSTQS
jgi:VanZ family protein